MSRKTFTTEEVLAFLEAEEDCELDDSQELFMEGSDEEFDELDEVEYSVTRHSLEHRTHAIMGLG